MIVKDFYLEFFRLAVAYGFYEPAMMKWRDISVVANWFANISISSPK